VTDNTGASLPGVAVVVAGASTGTETRIDGSYSISVPGNGQLTFAFIGMKTLTVPVNNRARIDVSMEDDAFLLDDVVVVAYGTQKRANISGAVATIDVGKALESRPITDIGRALQGSTPGLSVTTTSGALGGTPTIRIRGWTGTLGGGDGNPLILVDDVEVPNLSYVNPEDVESISTLKDAASTSIYGSRAAFGALLITTKKGREDAKVRVSYSNNFAWGKPTNLPEFTRADLAMQYSLDQQNGLLASPVQGFAPYSGYHISNDVIAKTRQWIETYGDGASLGREMVEGRDFDYNRGGSPLFYRPWDVRSLFYKDWAPQQTNNLSVSGGTKDVKYNLSAGIVNQNGVLQQFDDHYKRLNVSGNITIKANKYLTFRGGYMYAKTDADSPMSFYAGTTDLQADIYGPTYYVYRWHENNPYGTFNGREFRNGVAEMKAAKPVEDNTYYSRYTLGVTATINKHISATFDYTYNQTFVTQHRTGGHLAAIDIFSSMSSTQASFDDMYRIYTGVQADYASYDASRNLRNAYNGSLVYNNDFGNHAIRLQVGTNIEDAEYIYQRSKRMTLYDYDKGEVNLANGDQMVSSSHSWWSIAGVYARLNYNFKERYILEGNIRYDASSKFAAGRRGAYYPSFSAAWRVTEEPFMQNVKHVVNSLKIRTSYGSIGSQDVPLNSYIPTISITNPTTGNYWLVNGNYVPQASTPALVDPTLTWETVSNLDFGIDAAFLRNKLILSAGWYKRTTSNMLSAGVVIPSSIGASAPRQNYGSLATTGIEISLNFNHTFRNGLRLEASGQFSDYTTEITKWASVDDPLFSDNYVGKRLGDIWGFKVDRLWQKDDFVYDANGKIQTVTLPGGKVTNVLKNYEAGYQEIFESGNFRYSPGDIKIMDLNGDGVINRGTNALSDLGDRAVIGNSQPRYQYGFRLAAYWKGFDVDVFFQGVGKRNIWVTGNVVLPGWMAGEANFAHTLDYWTEENTGAFYNRPMNYANSGDRWNYVMNDRYILNMAYLRCKNVNIGYTLPGKINKKLSIERMRIYASAENLFEFDHLGDNPIDPELDHTNLTSNDARAFGRAYPYRRTFSFGVQLTF